VSEYGEAIAAGENLYSPIDVCNLARFGNLRPGKDVIQWNVTQNYGVSSAAKILRMLAEMGWSSRQVVPHSGTRWRSTRRPASASGCANTTSMPSACSAASSTD